MKQQLKRISFIGSLCAAILVISLAGCSLFSGGSGTLSLSLTDAPIADAAEVEGVYITIDGISYHTEGGWVDDTSFAGPQTYNLLELTGGTVAPLSDLALEAGTITQIRFLLAATEEGTDPSDDPLCYIAIDPDGTADGDSTDDTIYELFVPSGDQTGYKANGPFTVPVNGSVEITADFDVRKSVTKTGEGSYKLKPTIRLIVNAQAGEISGTFTEDTLDGYSTYVIFVYEDGVYDASELSESFSNAVSSATPVDEDESGSYDAYILPFLAEGTYDLVVAGVAGDGSYTLIDDTTYIGISVTAGSATTRPIDLTPID